MKSLFEQAEELGVSLEPGDSLFAQAERLGVSLEPDNGSMYPLPGQKAHIPDDMPQWTGMMPTSDAMILNQAKREAEAHPEGSPEWQNAMREYTLKKLSFDEKQKLLDAKYGEFQESGMSAQDYQKKQLADQALFGPSAPALARAVAEGGGQVGLLPVSLYARATGDGDLADYIREEQSQRRQYSDAAISTAAETRMMAPVAGQQGAEWMTRQGAGAAESLTKSLIGAGMGGGLTGIAGMFAADVGEQSYYDARQKGLSEIEARNYALRQGGIEGLLTVTIGKMFPTVEAQVGGVMQGITPEVQRSLRESATAVVKAMASEVGEETAVTILQQTNDQMSRVSPELTGAEWLATFRDTATQAALASGATSASVGAIEKLAKNPLLDKYQVLGIAEATGATETAPEVERSVPSQVQPETREEAAQSPTEDAADTRQEPAAAVEEESPVPDAGEDVAEPAGRKTRSRVPRDWEFVGGKVRTRRKLFKKPRSQVVGIEGWQPPADATANEDTDPDTGKKLWEMSGSELLDLQEKSKQEDIELRKELFGEDWKKYRGQEDMEDRLTHEQLDRLYGYNLKYPSPDDIEPYVDATQRGMGSTVDQLAEGLRYALPDLPNKNTDPSEWTPKQRQAMSTMQEAIRSMEQMGLESEAVTRESFIQAAKRWPDQNDAKFMLENATSWLSTGVGKLPQQPTKKLAGPETVTPEPEGNTQDVTVRGEKYGVYPEAGKWLVNSGSKDGFGDTVWDTKEEAEEFSAQERARDESRAARVAEIEEAEAKEASDKARRLDIGDFKADSPDITRRRAATSLDKQLNTKAFGVVTRRQLMEKLVESGDALRVEEKDGELRLYVKDRENGGEYFYRPQDVTKTAIEYAQHLMQKEKQPSATLPEQSPPEPVEETAVPVEEAAPEQPATTLPVRDGEGISLANVPTPILRKIKKTRDGEISREAAIELDRRGDRGFQELPEESQALSDAFNEARAANDDARIRLSRAEKEMGFAEQRALLRIANEKYGVPFLQGRATKQLSNAKKYGKLKQQAKSEVESSPEYLEAKKELDNAKAERDSTQAAYKEASREYEKAYAKAFPKIPAGTKFNSILPGSYRDSRTVEGFNEETGLYQTDRGEISAAALNDNFTTDEESGEVRRAEDEFRRIRGELNAEKMAVVREQQAQESREKLKRYKDKARAEREAPAQPPGIEADTILDASDLQHRNHPFLSDKGHQTVKKMVKDVPEFAYHPVFTVEVKEGEDGMTDTRLVFRDGVTYRLNPEAFNLEPSELKHGQTVGINLPDLGLKKISGQDAVVKILKNMGAKTVSKKLGTGVTANFGDKGSVRISGEEDAWSVDGVKKGDIAKQVEAELKRTGFLKGEEGVEEKQEPKKLFKGKKSATGTASSPGSGTITNKKLREEGDTDPGIAASNIIKTWERLFGTKILAGRVSSPKAAAYYKIFPEVVRAREPYLFDLGTAIHELAHHLDKTLRVTGYVHDKGVKTKKLPNALAEELARLDYEPDKGRVFEGFAEFIRFYVTHPDVEKNGKNYSVGQLIAPNFYGYFTGEWAKQNPEAFANLQKAREQATQYRNQSLFQRLGTLIGNAAAQDLEFDERLKRDMRKTTHRLFRDFVDKFAGLKKLQDAADARGYKGKLRAYDAAMFYDRTEAAHANRAIEAGVHDIRTGEQIGAGLWDSLRPHIKDESEYEEAIRYAYARHTLYEAEKNPGYFTGMEKADAEAYIRQTPEEKRNRYEAFSSALASYNNDLITMLVNAGVMAPDAAERLFKRYGDHYMPLHRVMDDGKSGMFSGAKLVDLPQTPLKSRTKQGSSRQIVDPVEATIARALHFYRRAGQARVQQAIIDTVTKTPGLGVLADKVPPKTKPVQGKVREVLKDLVREGVITAEEARNIDIATRLREGEPVSEKDRQWFMSHHGIEEDQIEETAEQQPDGLAEITMWRADYSPEPGKRIALLYGSDGKPQLYQFDEDLYDALTDAGPTLTGPWLEVWKESVRAFKTGAVGASTGFGSLNLVRDYAEYQGKATEVKGAQSLTKPLPALAGYAAYKAQKALGKKPKNAVYETFEELGGDLYSRISHNKSGRARARKEGLNQSKWSTGKRLFSAPRRAIEAVEETVAITDAPPRLAEMEASLLKDGYELTSGGQFRNVETGSVVDSLPEHVRIRAMLAASEATVNFKRVGRWGRHVETFLPLPFFNATIQSQYRLLRQLKPLGKKLLQKPTTETEDKQVARTLLVMSGLVATGALHWLFRQDDDDYREQDAYLRDQFWTFGAGGKTYARIPKPRDLAVFDNATSAILDNLVHDDARPLGEVLFKDFKDRLPGGGGPMWGAWGLATNYDNFREREIVPSYMKDWLPEDQYNEYTTSASKNIGKVTGPWMGVSPLEVEHMLSSGTGGFYRRIADSWDALYEGRLGPEHVPFLRGFGINRHQARSLSDFYDEVRDAELKAMREPSPEATDEVDRLRSYQELISAIREKEPRADNERRTFEYQNYLVGLAREALNRSPLESNPSPLSMESPPEAIRGVVAKFAEDRAKKAVLGMSFPIKSERADGKTIEEATEAWKLKADRDSQFLERFLDNPTIREAVEESVRSADPGKRPRPTRSGDYRQRVLSWQEKMRRVRYWRKKLADSK